MKTEPIEIEIYDKRNKSLEFIFVEKLSDTKFRAAENLISNCRITLGTEFETRLNKDLKHEITRITKESDFTTRRFFLDGKFTEEEYLILGDEIIKQGGLWQVDLGNLATINLPKDSKLDLDEIFRIFEFSPTEIKDED